MEKIPESHHVGPKKQLETYCDVMARNLDGRVWPRQGWRQGKHDGQASMDDQRKPEASCGALTMPVCHVRGVGRGGSVGWGLRTGCSSSEATLVGVPVAV